MKAETYEEQDISHRVAERGNRRQYAVSSRQEEVKRAESMGQTEDSMK